MLRIGSAVSGTQRSEALEILCSLQLQTLLQSTLDNALEDWSLGKDAASTNPAVASSGLVEVLLSSARAAHYRTHYRPPCALTMLSTLVWQARKDCAGCPIGPA